MTPLAKYQQDLLKDDFKKDSAQQMAVEKLQGLYDALVMETVRPNKEGFLGKLAANFSRGSNNPPIRGLYFWGGVGRGKTYLMDVFYDCLPFEKKTRLHFHRFMQQVHRQLKQFEGQKNPLDRVARDIAAKNRVICFDEFFVSDIADAMILGGLFHRLFELGVSLVATSNIVPDKLYENGLQRQRFLPAIAALKVHCEVVNVGGGVDYRLRQLEQAELYHHPLDSEADIGLLQSFHRLASNESEGAAVIEINRREFIARMLADGVVWFDFDELCSKPRSQNDYIELARLYHAVIVSNVPQLNRDSDDQARRMIGLVDEFYDRNVKLVISAAQPIEMIYAGGALNFEFERTRSRLLEMQSLQYLALEHRP